MSIHHIEQNPVVVKIVREYAHRRGIADHQLPGYLNPTLDLGSIHLPDMGALVSRLSKAIQLRERVLLFGDYDADGVCATAILLRFMRECSPLQPSFLLPSRQTGEYGLTMDRLSEILAAKPSLVMTLDCGTNSREPIQILASHGVDTLVIDHHPSEEEQLPANASSVLNPKLGQTAEQNLTELCAAGLVLVACHALAEAWGTLSQWDHEQAVMLAGLATLADACRLTPLNRSLVKDALRLLNTPRTVARNRGLAALLPETGACRLSQRALQFDTIPKLNALGRLGSATPAVELLTTHDPQKAKDIAEFAQSTNLERQRVQAEILQTARAQAGEQLARCPSLELLVLADRKWHHGVVGPSASRIAEEFQRSAILLGLDHTGNWRGSGRSYRSHDLGRLVGELRKAGRILRGGGHSAAVGITLANSQLEHLQRESPSPVVPHTPSWQPEVEVVGQADELHPHEWQRLAELLEPFGAGNPFPILAAPGCLLLSEPRPLLLKSGTPWAMRLRVRTRKGRLLHVTWRDQLGAMEMWRTGRKTSFELEFTWRSYQGRVYYDWLVRAAA